MHQVHPTLQGPGVGAVNAEDLLQHLGGLPDAPHEVVGVGTGPGGVLGLPEEILALAEGLQGVPAGQGGRQTVGNALEGGDELGREAAGPVVVELEQPEGLPAHPQRDQGHGLVPLSVAPVPRTGLAVLIGGGGQQLRGAVAPEAAMGGEEGLARVRSATDDIATHALERGAAAAIGPYLAKGVAGTEAVLQLDKGRREAPGLHIGEVLPFPQADAHGLAPGPGLQGGRELEEALLEAIRRLDHGQHPKHGLPLSLLGLPQGNVPEEGNEATALFGLVLDADLDIEEAAVPAPVPGLEPELPGAHDPLDVVGDARFCLGVFQVRDGQGEQLLLGVPTHPAVALVDLQNTALLIHLHEAVHGRVEQHAVELVPAAQDPLDPVPVHGLPQALGHSLQQALFLGQEGGAFPREREGKVAHFEGTDRDFLHQDRFLLSPRTGPEVGGGEGLSIHHRLGAGQGRMLPGSR